MSPAHIKTRLTKSGKRYYVYYRRGGRDTSLQYAGSFKRRADAATRRDLVGGWLAAGLDPKKMLAELAAPTAAPRLDAAWGAYIASRVDVGAKTLAQARISKTHWTRILGADRDPATVTANDVIAGIAELVKVPLSPGTVGQYVSGLSQLLDFCDIDPNPVRSPKVKLPAATAEEVNPPTTAEWTSIKAQARARSLLALRLIECCALRVSEATKLEYGDIDFHERRIRVARARTKTAAGQRWIPVPEELLDAIADLRAPEDRVARPNVFGLEHGQVRYDLAHACTDAGVVRHGPHDLRHRRISLWLRLGIDPVTVSRWAGHARTSMSLDLYGHVVLDPREDEWRSFWDGVYGAKGSRREAPVRHEGGETDD